MKKMRPKQMFCLIISIVLLMMDSKVTGENTDKPAPEINLSSIVPVVNQELEIKIEQAPLAEEGAVFSITSEGRNIVEEKVKPLDGKIIKKWTPAETGFYTVSFDFGKRAPGKLSFEFPVVWRELYFVAWPPVVPSERDLRYLSSYVICSEKDIPYWKSKGAKTVCWTSGMHAVDMGISEEEAIKKAVAIWSTPIKQGFDGIFMDEFGEYPLPELLKKVERAGKALIQLRKENPDMLIFPAAGGALLREETISYKYSDSVALIETYNNSFEQVFGTHSFEKHLDHRVMVARNTDLIYERGRKHGAIILLGMGCDGGGMLISQLEEQVRYVKSNAPEMPGIGFYGGGREKQWTIDTGLRQAAEDFCLKYYIKPVVDIREIWLSDYSPRAGEETDIFIRVHNLGGMHAKDVKLQLYAIASGKGEREQIGKGIIIKKIGTGWVDIKLNKEDQPGTYYEYQEINGNTYPVFQKKNIICIDRHVAKASWKPGEKGYYTIIAELEHSDNYTILNGIMKKDVNVRKR